MNFNFYIVAGERKNINILIIFCLEFIKKIKKKVSFQKLN